MNLKEPNAFFEFCLAMYLNESRKNYAYGIEHLKSVCCLHYDQAIDVLEYGIAKGVLERDSKHEWKHRII